MLKYFRYICLIILLITSFIGTDLLVKHLKMQDPIFISIKELENEYKKEPINAIIEDNYIIPGVNGIMLDVNYSYKKMKGKKSFLPSSLSLKEFKPDISIINNKDKIIKHANPYKKGVSLLTISDEIANYLDKEVIPYSILTTINNVLSLSMRMAKEKNYISIRTPLRMVCLFIWSGKVGKDWYPYWRWRM